MPSKDRYHNEKFPSEKASSTRCSASNSAIVRLYQGDMYSRSNLQFWLDEFLCLVPVLLLLKINKTFLYHTWWEALPLRFWAMTESRNKGGWIKKSVYSCVNPASLKLDEFIWPKTMSRSRTIKLNSIMIILTRGQFSWKFCSLL